MDLTHTNDLKSLLGKFQIRLSKKLGQHFLIDRLVLAKIVDCADLKKSDTILEIGPGAGTLTIELAKSGAQIVGVEKDPKMMKPLQLVVRDFHNIKIINADILKFDLVDFSYRLQAKSYKLIADIPYYITGEILKKFLTAKHKPAVIVLLIQKEVAERIVAASGQMSLLALSVQLYGVPKIISYVSKDSFFPAPEVDSAILKIEIFDEPKIEVEEKQFFRLLKIGFSSKRKTLANNLAAGLKRDKVEIVQKLEALGFSPKARAQELSLHQWKQIYDLVL